MPSVYLYDDAKIAYGQLDELLSCGFIAGVVRWDGSGKWMVSFDIR
jgi:hypothetical protein